MKTYRNPLHIFQLDAHEAAQLDVRGIRRVKMKRLAEIELSDTDFIDVGNQSLGKNDILLLTIFQRHSTFENPERWQKSVTSLL